MVLLTASPSVRIDLRASAWQIIYRRRKVRRTYVVHSRHVPSVCCRDGGIRRALSGDNHRCTVRQTNARQSLFARNRIVLHTRQMICHLALLIQWQWLLQ